MNFQAPISRREFLRIAALSVGAVVTAPLLNACAGPSNPNIRPTSVPTLISNHELDQAEVSRIARLAINDYNRVLGLNVNAEKAVSSVQMVATLSEYQNILKNMDDSYIPQDETNRIAVTDDKRKKIYIYKPGYDFYTKTLPQTEQGKQGREEFLEKILTHELAHWAAPEYMSPEIHKVVYGTMLANLPNNKGKPTEDLGVQGAKIYAKVGGEKRTNFKRVEEAEADLISNHVMLKRGKPKTINYPDIGLANRLRLLGDLIIKLGPDANENVKNLAQLRGQEKGREAICGLIGKTHNKPSSDHLFFGMSVLYAIEVGDETLYRQLTSPNKNSATVFSDSQVGLWGNLSSDSIPDYGYIARIQPEYSVQIT